MIKLELRDVTKSFGAVRALSSVSLAVERGELLAVVGPSGCGKTTLLRLIAGFDQPDTGDILLDGRSVLADPPERRRVGIVFQDFALFPHMSVADNIAYGLRSSGEWTRPTRATRVAELLELVELKGYAHRMPHELSAGEQQRVALARALAPRPAMLLLDEPLSALDALLREELRTEIRRLQGEVGVSTLHVTHDQVEALAIADRVAVMCQGRLEQVAPAQELYVHPLTEFAARFIGHGNLLPCRFIRSAQGGSLVELPGVGEFKVASAIGGRRQGQAAYLLVRPERIALGENLPIRLVGKLLGSEFFGEQTRHRVSWETQEVLVALPTNRAWKGRKGDTINLSFDPGDCWLLPPAQSP